MTDLTQNRLQHVVEYNEKTGLFMFRHGRGGKPKGTIAGTLNEKGYRCIVIDSRRYRAHRLAWLYVHGAWPADEIDHIDGDRDNNRIGNLREAGRSENLQNQRKAQKRNKTGLLGVSPRRGRHRATIVINGKQEHIGDFDSEIEAHNAYIERKRIVHPRSNL